MNKVVFCDSFQPGDIIKGRINSLPFIYHYGIIVKKGGRVTIIHNSPNRKNKYGGNILADDIEDWLKTREMVGMERTNISEDRICRIVDKYKYRSFNLVAFNCEHFILEIKTGRPSSPQFREMMDYILTIILIIYSIRNTMLIKKIFHFSKKLSK